ncbi:hypothetical protein [Haladaptatus salinisoli]|uniref:hypothetical protein n=1 Tax=Haladaptatus salinisoli TaxID=2884876 RepID=UPI001D0B7710|nr:hypothetical protein [Haladaptatus salinisoli]
MREVKLRQAAQAIPLVLLGTLVVVVAGVGLVGFVAETQQTWRWYFRMEQAIAIATPIALALAGASLVALLGAILFVRE